MISGFYRMARYKYMTPSNFESPHHQQLKPVSFSSILLALSLVYVIWGSTYLAIRVAVETFPPFLMAALRFLAAGPLLYGWMRIKGEEKPRLLHWRSALIIGTLLLACGNGGVVWAEQTVPSGLAALFVSVIPLWMFFFDWIRPNGKKPHMKIILGALLGLIGLVILIGPSQFYSVKSMGHGTLVLLLAPITWGFGSVYSKRAPLPSSPFLATAMEMICGGVVLLLMSIVSGETHQFSFHSVSRNSWLCLLYLIVLGALVGFTAYIWLLKNASISIASTYAYVNPVVAVILGWIFLDEKLSTQIICGGVVILIGVALMSSHSEKESKLLKAD